MNEYSDPKNRQVLVNLGNRYVVFGPSLGLPQKMHFDPYKDSEVLPRVADESENAGVRIVQTLRVYNMVRSELTEKDQRFYADLALMEGEGRQIFVDIKTRFHDPKKRDFETAFIKIKEAKAEHKNLEVWFFNLERLNLSILSNGEQYPSLTELPPTNVWEKTEDGVFLREKVVFEVENWANRILTLYSLIQNWMENLQGFEFNQSRTVTMSEELMQKYAVNDKDLPVLDIVHKNQVLASFVPRGLWIIGAWGRIDLITSKQTFTLVVLRDNNNDYEWHIVSPENRLKTKAFSKVELLSALVLE